MEMTKTCVYSTFASVVHWISFEILNGRFDAPHDLFMTNLVINDMSDFVRGQKYQLLGLQQADNLLRHSYDVSQGLLMHSISQKSTWTSFWRATA